MSDSEEIKIEGGCIYESQNIDGDNSKFIVTVVGLSRVLFADFPMIKFNESYLEYCVTRKEFQKRFKLSE
ncbi:hypothetical protein VXI92_004943 [Enterobacter hormaechei]|uniref:Uncharacterized protein n=1 Tax=Enterobacter hormaechei TaxID=158836 RepID=A0AAE8X5H6_9ENTR|nr:MULTISPECIES: hypothetical protein [Enterobacter]AVO82559.1 hypothetical protein AM472_09010 [Enterobacter cloacae complex sp.]EIM34063.1 hypothetical protein PGS1_22466 [Enterobacter cloacae subsp. cloacae GS1]CAE7562244.1 hypothetical protein AI2759V1_0859 [Enterobacter cloacae]VAU69499.1 Uncharacterised protein [Klebsiella pneumoniae]DAR48983.1 MAG TPA: hypothetical protein [Caudoviricetes sp.]